MKERPAFKPAVWKDALDGRKHSGEQMVLLFQVRARAVSTDREVNWELEDARV